MLTCNTSFGEIDEKRPKKGTQQNDPVGWESRVGSFVVLTQNCQKIGSTLPNEILKRLKTVKKVFSPAFRCVHHPKAGQDTQQTS